MMIVCYQGFQVYPVCQGLSGTSGLSGLSGVSQDSSFATILQSYLTKAIHSQNDSAQDAQMAEKLSDVLQEAAKTEDTFQYNI